MNTRCQNLLQSIERAFAGVELGDGVSLHQTIEIDNHMRGNSRHLDEKHDWRKLINDPELARICGVGGLSFYDAEGLRFHLPAYLSWALTTVDESDEECLLEVLQFTLTRLCDYQFERFAILNNEQRNCVLSFLKYMHEFRGWQDCSSEDYINQAIGGYWSLPQEACQKPESG